MAPGEVYMKIDIIGCGKGGKTIATRLAGEGHDITVVDHNRATLTDIAQTVDVMAVESSAFDYAAHIEKENPADLLISCTNSDEVNMLTGLLARKNGVARTIVRVRNPEYHDNMNQIKDELGLSMAINPEMIAADTISRVLLFPAADGVETFSNGRAELIEYPVNEGNPLIGKSMRDINMDSKVKVLIAAIERDGEVIIPTGSDVVRQGDKIYIAAGRAQIQTFLRSIDSFKTSVETVIIVGGGRISYYLAERLIREGMTVKIIERDRVRCEELAQILPEANIVWGSGTHEELLGEEGITQADAFVALTGIDEINVIIALYAKKMGVEKVVAKVNQLSFTDMLKSIGVDTIVSPKKVTANVILRYVRALHASGESSSIESLSRLVDGRVEALEVIIRENAGYVGVPLKDLKIKSGFLVACIGRRNRVIVPGGFDTIEVGDSVVIVTTHAGVTGIEEIFR